MHLKKNVYSFEAFFVLVGTQLPEIIVIKKKNQHLSQTRLCLGINSKELDIYSIKHHDFGVNAEHLNTALTHPDTVKMPSDCC